MYSKTIKGNEAFGKIDEIFEPLELIDLNDDCLYEIFSHLDSTALANLTETHLRFVPIARYFFLKRYFTRKSNLQLLSQLL